MSFNDKYQQYLQGSFEALNTALGGFPILARVTHIVQGPFLIGTTIPDAYYENATSLGVILFENINSLQASGLQEGGNVTAKPIYAGFKQYPIEGELVYVIPGPSVLMNESRNRREYYYFPPYNTWCSSHHNAFPNLGSVQSYVDVIGRDYQNTVITKQSVNTGADKKIVFPLSPNFPEKESIKSLRQFTGDVTLEGRWGNSIRLGSTVFTTTRENDWSDVDLANSGSEYGNPITIIRNGQGKPTNNIAWIPTVENINRDPSSIYLTQGQKIVIEDIENFSLASLGVVVEDIQVTAIPIQQQLTSTETTSAQEQDNVTKNITNPGLPA